MFVFSTSSQLDFFLKFEGTYIYLGIHYSAHGLIEN